MHISVSALSEKTIYGGTFSFRAISILNIRSLSNSIRPSALRLFGVRFSFLNSSFRSDHFIIRCSSPDISISEVSVSLRILYISSVSLRYPSSSILSITPFIKLSLI